MVECVIIVLYSLLWIGSWVGVGVFMGFVLGLLYSPSYYDGSENVANRRRWNAAVERLTSLTYLFQKHYFDYTIEYRARRPLDDIGINDSDDDNDSAGKRRARALKEQVERVLQGKEDRAAIFAASPHGLLAISTVFHTVLPLDPVWRNAVTCVHRHMFFFPLVRELALWLGVMNVTRANMVQHLQRHQCLYLAPGGCREMIIDKEHPIQTKHSGFLRVAFAEQVPVYPVIHMGQEEVFRSVTWPWLDRVRSMCLDVTGYPFPTFFTPPLPRKLTSHVFEPLDPRDFDKNEEAFVAAYWTLVQRHYEQLHEEAVARKNKPLRFDV
jgi:hypothetical protein